MSAIHIDFQHWRYTFPEHVLIRYGGPYFSATEAGKHLMREVIPNLVLKSSFATAMDRRQVFCANEAYPEAALADPLADLDVWNEWVSGIRIFPYPGQYTPLGITAQEGKTSSPSSVGVLGEIMGGLFAEAYISPQVLVRTIRHWPDFIFYSGNGMYSFVESKAFTVVEEGTEKLLRDLGIEDESGASAQGFSPERLSRKAFPELLVDAVHQLNSDAFVTVWGAFTGVQQIAPTMRLTVTFFEFDVPDERRQNQAKRMLPHAVVQGVARRAVSLASCRLNEAEMAVFRQTPGQRTRNSEEDGDPGPWQLRVGQERPVIPLTVEKKLKAAALDEVSVILEKARDDAATRESMEVMIAEIDQIIRNFVFSEQLEGTRFFISKGPGAGNVLRPVRTVGNDMLVMGSLSAKALQKLDAEWKADWKNAKNPWRVVDRAPLWRCGGSVFGLGSHALEGTEIG